MQYRTARQMVFDALLAYPQSTMSSVAERAKLGCEVQETRKQNQDGKIAHGLEAGAVVSRVDSLPPEQRELILAAFGPFEKDRLEDHRNEVAKELVRQAMEKGIKTPGRDIGQVLRLCQSAVWHHVETTWPYRRQGLPTPQAVRSWIAERGGSLDGRWTHVGRPGWWRLWAFCLDRLAEWEGEGLAPVAELLAEDRDARKPRHEAGVNP